METFALEFFFDKLGQTVAFWHQFADAGREERKDEKSDDVWCGKPKQAG